MNALKVEGERGGAQTFAGEAANVCVCMNVYGLINPRYRSFKSES